MVGAIPMAAFGILPQAIVANIADASSKTTGQDRQGMFYAARTFAMKMGQSVAMLLFTGVSTIGMASGAGYRIAAVCAAVLCGLGGICFAYSISVQFSSAIYMGYGYLAIAGLIFGNWQIMPTLAACLIFGFARSGGFALTQVMELPSAFTDVFMTLPYIVTLFLLIFFSKSNRAPRALGEIYDKGKR